MSKISDTCNNFKKPGLKPVVGFAHAKEFNEAVCMDLNDVTKYNVIQDIVLVLFSQIS